MQPEPLSVQCLTCGQDLLVHDGPVLRVLRRSYQVYFFEDTNSVVFKCAACQTPHRYFLQNRTLVDNYRKTAI